ncbi:hypothetical protein HWV62_19613 [Athelia sp. TMB]|nr:hypothetical protein HWV62_19597 [Athelia sp. TMB]KAF7983693.1 hypothetical protein HWV62_19613 [Athelia sp. TMB]
MEYTFSLNERPTKNDKIDEVLEKMRQTSGGLGNFLYDLFHYVPRGQYPRNSSKQKSMLSAFLGGRSDVKAEQIVAMMHDHPHSAPKTRREKAGRENADTEMVPPRSKKKKKDQDPKLMAKWGIQQWATGLIERIVDREARDMTSAAGGLRLPKEDVKWDFVHGFSLGRVMSTIQDKAPTLLRVLTAAAIPAKKRKLEGTVPTSFTEHFDKPIAGGSGNNRRDPFVIIAVVMMMIFAARNIQVVLFQQIIGLFLFGNSCSFAIYALMSRLGMSTSYTTVGKLLRRLTHVSQATIQEIVVIRGFLVIYDNINRMRRSWDPDLGQKDTVLSGTAATLVELEDCDVKKALDPMILKDAMDRGDRKKLTVRDLVEQVDFVRLHDVFGTHILKFLVDEIPSLARHRNFVNNRYKTTHSTHPMRPGRKSTIHPLQTSDINEGTTEGQKDVADDILLRQLGLTEEEIAKVLLILGGDQSTVEKLRTLRRYLMDCEHGYSNYRWALPLIQLWHMGWADLERVIATHWGPETGAAMADLSTFKAANVLLNRKVKNCKRPDYYPAQGLVFDTLRLEVLDCWKVLLDVTDLEDHFSQDSALSEIEDLLKQASKIARRYMSVRSAQGASMSSNVPGMDAFPNGAPFVPSAKPASADPLPGGDPVLGNTIIRMLDCMLHFEFQHAIGAGDIGRAMNVMAVWTFTFTGSGKGKYSNELLELACNFKYEYSAELKELIRNNWLVNLSGIEGCWFPMDLMQEHNIKQLKKLAERRDSTFGGTFFQDVVSMNIRATLHANDTIRASVRLGAQGGTHRRRKKLAAEKRLANAMAEHELHKFRTGRTYGHKAKDNFSEGYNMLATGNKIKNFITRTMSDAGAIHDTEGTAAGDDEPEEPIENPPLPGIIIDGKLVTGDTLEEEFGDDDTLDSDLEEEDVAMADLIDDSEGSTEEESADEESADEESAGELLVYSDSD